MQKEKLEAAGYDVSVRNRGFHYVVTGRVVVDFWPTTGKWITREVPPVKGEGLTALLLLLQDGLHAALRERLALEGYDVPVEVLKRCLR